MDPEAATLDEASILADARQTAGLDDFGDTSFREALRRLLAALDREARLTPIGRVVQRQRIVDLLANRLRVTELLRRHPEIHAEAIGAPIVIVGLPRTGTTLLHRTLAQDPRLHAVLWWECRYPAPLDPDERDGGAARVARAEAEVQAMLAGSPELAAMHPLDARAPDEEILLLEHTFLSTMPESSARVPSYGRWRETQDQAPAYAYLRTLLQVLQWQKRRAGATAERWVLKAPYHLGYADVLLATFPDATIVQTHRDPVEAVPSLASFIYALWTLAAEVVDRAEVGRLWSGKMAAALAACLAVRDRHPDRFVDVWFRDAVADTVNEARRIATAAGLSPDAEAEARMRRFVAGNPREGRPPHDYTLEEFGLSRPEIERAFAAYRARFVLGRR